MASYDPDISDEEFFGQVEGAVHNDFRSEMGGKLMERNGVHFPRYAKDDTWQLVMVIGYTSFCHNVWNKNIDRSGCSLNRWEVEVSWYELLMEYYKVWNPLGISRTNNRAKALHLAKKVLQQGMLQVYGLGKHEAVDEFWRRKKAQFPSINIDHVTHWPTEDPYKDQDPLDGPNWYCCWPWASPPIALSDIGASEVPDDVDLPAQRDSNGDVKMEDVGADQPVAGTLGVNIGGLSIESDEKEIVDWSKIPKGGARGMGS